MKLVTNLADFLVCPFQVVFDIVKQLDLDPSPFTQLLFRPICKLETISHWVDLDSLGDPVALRAYEVSRLLVSKLKQIDRIDLSVYLGAYSLEIDNYYALLILENLFEGILTVSLYANNETSASLQQNSPEPSSDKTLTLTILSSNSLLEQEGMKEQLNSLQNNRYQLLQQFGFDFFDPTTQAISLSNLEYHSSFVRFIWTGLKSGAYPISTRLLDYVLAFNNLSEEERESLLMHQQHIHFLSHQHEKVIQHNYPSAFKYQKANIVQNLYFIKAFSATLLRQFNIAAECFALAEVTLDMPIVDENSLYQLNLFALHYLSKGEIDSAFALENKLNHYLETNAIQTIAINYVVLLNLARLYKKAKFFEKSFNFYEKAYEHIRKGGFTLFDSMYYNMDKASLYESSEHYNKAITLWIKVALYWLSSENPLSLALKPRVVLCQEHVTETLKPLNRDKVSHFLFNKINMLAKKLGLEEKQTITKNYVFISNDINHKKNTCYITNDFMLYGCQLSNNSNNPSLSPIEQSLHQLITFLLTDYMNITIQEEAIMIDGQYENYRSKSLDACITSASWHECSNYFWQGSVYPVDSNNLGRMQLKLSPLIDSWDIHEHGITLYYKRNFLNTTINNPYELELLNRLINNKYLDKSQLQQYPKEAVISLLMNHVIDIEFSSELQEEIAVI